jgi:hypothetical protein
MKTPRSRFTVEEELLEPFYLVCDEDTFTIMKRGVDIPKGYYTSLDGAILRIAKHLMVQVNNQNSVTIKEYLRQYSEFVEKLKQIISI